MRIELTKKEVCPTCKRLEIATVIIVKCDGCDKEVTESFNNSITRAFETWLYEKEKKAVRKHYCSWECFVKDMIRMAENDYLMNRIEDITMPYMMNIKTFKTFVEEVLKRKNDVNKLKRENEMLKNALLETKGHTNIRNMDDFLDVFEESEKTKIAVQILEEAKKREASEIAEKIKIGNTLMKEIMSKKTKPMNKKVLLGAKNEDNKTE